MEVLLILKNCGAMSNEESCGYIAGSNEPCEDCPLVMTALHMCDFLKEGFDG